MKEIQREIYKESECKDGISGGLDQKFDFNNFEK